MTIEELSQKIEADVPEILDDQPLEDDDAQQVEVDPYEEEAKEYGWKPADEWQGDQSGHISAERFMTRGAGATRKLQKTVEDLNGRLASTEADVSERLSRTEAAMRAAGDARVKAAEERIRKEMMEAVESGDTERFTALDKEREEVRRGSEPDSKGPTQEDKAVVQGWIAENPLFKTDTTFNALTNRFWQDAMNDGMSDPSAIFKVVDRRLREELPHKFKTDEPSPRPRAPSVETGGVKPAKKRGKGWADIPNADRSQAQSFIDDGLFDDLAKEMKVTPQEAYASKYHEDQSQ